MTSKAGPARPKEASRGKKRTRKAKKPPPYVYGPIPDDVFGAKNDPAVPHGPQAPHLIPTVRFTYLINNPDLYTAAVTLPGPAPSADAPTFRPSSI